MSIETPAVPFQSLRPSELASAALPRLSWLWQGLLAPHKLTALVSPSKTGKTTLLSLLLARLAQGGQLAGLAVTPGRAVIVSEEGPDDWDARCKQLGIGQNVQFLCRPFRGARPTDAQWLDLVAHLGALHRQEPLDLVAIDPLSLLLPGYAETIGAKMFDCLLPLQTLAQQGPAVWLLHHPGRGRRSDGQASRGSTVLTGFVDINMEMSSYRRARSRDRRRRICTYSRYVETPRHLIIELNAEGTDYLVRTDAAGAPIVKQLRPELQSILSSVFEKQTLEQIQEHWPQEVPHPTSTTLWRWLKRAMEQGLICCSGTGIRGDPFRYWLPSQEPLFFPAPTASEEEKQAWQARYTAYVNNLLGFSASP